MLSDLVWLIEARARLGHESVDSHCPFILPARFDREFRRHWREPQSRYMAIWGYEIADGQAHPGGKDESC